MTDNMDMSIGIELSNEAIEIVSDNIIEPEFCVNKNLFDSSFIIQ